RDILINQLLRLNLANIIAPRAELTPALREHICKLHAIGWGYKCIHKRYPYARVYCPDNALLNVGLVSVTSLEKVNVKGYHKKALLKAKIHKLRSGFIGMRNNDKSKATSVETAQIAWHELEIRHLQHLSETMPHRVEAIIESQDWYSICDTVFGPG
ncbi:Transposable element tc3 transposase, partial [Penicillium hispanicum]|uniref:Transposable element tc3 transposase n=1 Tax=Penicillium hispanicum TaxID=1080232 RepID=UPI00254079F4